MDAQIRNSAQQHHQDRVPFPFSQDKECRGKQYDPQPVHIFRQQGFFPHRHRAQQRKPGAGDQGNHRRAQTLQDAL